MEKNYRAELTGVFGDPVDANPTGVMEEAGFRAKGLNFRYITARVLPESLGAAVAGARAMHMKGFNLTMPHKVRVIPFLDGVTEAARIIGAVNTVYEENGNYIGENTDGKGFVEALKMQGESVEGKRVVLLGAGGAGKAIGVECALAGARHIAVVNRNRERGEDLVKTIRENTAWRGRLSSLAGALRDSRVRRAGQRHLRRPCAPGRAEARHRLRLHAAGHGGLRRGVQPRMAAVFARGARARRQGDHRAWHARVPGRAQFRAVDGAAGAL